MENKENSSWIKENISTVLSIAIVAFGGLSVWFQTQHTTESNKKDIKSLKDQQALEIERIEQELFTEIKNLKDLHKSSVVYLNEEDDGVRSDMDKEDQKHIKRLERLEQFMIDHLKKEH